MAAGFTQLPLKIDLNPDSHSVIRWKISLILFPIYFLFEYFRQIVLKKERLLTASPIADFYYINNAQYENSKSVDNLTNDISSDGRPKICH